jgi:hypothetical protein
VQYASQDGVVKWEQDGGQDGGSGRGDRPTPIWGAAGSNAVLPDIFPLYLSSFSFSAAKRGAREKEKDKEERRKSG